MRYMMMYLMTKGALHLSLARTSFSVRSRKSIYRFPYKPRQYESYLKARWIVLITRMRGSNDIAASPEAQKIHY